MSISNAELQATIKTALLASLARHGQPNYGVVVNVPQFLSGGLDKVTGYFGLTNVVAEIADAVEARLASVEERDE